MKKILFILGISPLLIGLTSAYNCSTLVSRLSDFVTRQEDYLYRLKISAAKGEKISNEYEASLWFEEYYRMEAEGDAIDAEKEILDEEHERCNEQSDKYNDYLRIGGTAKKELMDSGKYDSKLLDKAISNYEKAYDIAFSSKILDSDKLKLLKEDINSMKDLKETEEKLAKNEKERNKLTEQYNEALEYGNKGNYDKAISILEKIIKNEGTIERGDNYKLAKEALNIYKEGKKKLEEGEKYYQETGKVPTNGNNSNLPELNQAILWMYEKGLTIFNEPESFMASRGLRRDEAAKFYVQYAKQVMGKTPDYSRQGCNFKDLSEAWSDLKDIIVESCQLGLFQGSNGKFMPTQQLTNAQAITVFMRLLEGYKDETGTHFANNYYESAHNQGFLYDTPLDNRGNFDVYTTRGDVAKMLFRGQKQ